jgi:site-specific recombinase XerD
MDDGGSGFAPASIHEHCDEAYRHAYATHLLEQKIDIRLIQVLLGHKRLTTTETYSHVASRVLREVVSPLEHLALELGTPH